MKRHFTLLSLLILSSALILSSCKKEEVVGPKGPKGDTGNANVRVYQFGQKTFTGELILDVPGLTKDDVDNSIALVYYNPSNEAEGSWYPCPGLGSVASYETRFALLYNDLDVDPYNLFIRLHNPVNNDLISTSVTFREIKLIIVPGTNITNVNMPKVDLDDYQAVKEFYNIAE